MTLPPNEAACPDCGMPPGFCRDGCTGRLPPTVEEVVERLRKWAAPTRGFHDSGYRTVHADFCAEAASLIASLQAERDDLAVKLSMNDAVMARLGGECAAARERAEAAEAERDALRTRVEEMRGALKDYQAAIASCLSAGGVVIGADDRAAAWWDQIIAAQQSGARALKRDGLC